MTNQIIELENIEKNKINQIIKIIISSNENTIIAKLGKSFLIKFITLCIKSNNFKVFIYLKNNKIIAYAIIAKKEKYLLKELNKLKFTIIQNIIIKFKIKLIFDIFLILINKDLYNIEINNKNLLNNSPNLTYLAVDKEFRNQKIGTNFVSFIFNNYYKNSYVSVETDNEKTLNFYEKYLGFKKIGKRTRSSSNLILLIKKI